MVADRIRAWAKPLFLANKGTKILSLIIAVVVWYGIRGAISFEAVLEDLPVRILHDEGWAIREGAEQTVDVRFLGSRGDIRGMTRDQALVSIDVRGDTTTGQRVVTLTPKNVKAPTGARAVYIRPEQVTFSLDREAEKTLPVRPEFQGQLPDGFEIEQVICTPEQVTVHAPSAHLAPLEAIRTTPVDLDGRIQSFRVRRPLVPAGTMRLEPDRVHIEVVIREQGLRREIAAVPLHLLLRPGQQAPAFSPDEVQVELQGRPDVLQKLDPRAVRAYLVIPSVQTDRNLPVRVHVPAGIRVVGVTPESVPWNLNAP
jgi:YbbR domain-containing protein